MKQVECRASRWLSVLCWGFGLAILHGGTLELRHEDELEDQITVMLILSPGQQNSISIDVWGQHHISFLQSKAGGFNQFLLDRKVTLPDLDIEFFPDQKTIRFQSKSLNARNSKLLEKLYSDYMNSVRRRAIESLLSEYRASSDSEKSEILPELIRRISILAVDWTSIWVRKDASQKN